MGTLHRVFVYGTLKKGEPNHHWFEKDADGYHKFLCKGWTTEKYPLVIATKYNIPFLLHNPGLGHHVEGEVYEVCDFTLRNLDELEEHPNYYERIVHPIKLKNEEIINSWVYFLKSFKPDLLLKPTYKSYSNNGEHGLKYMERYLRDTNYNFKEDIFAKQQ